MKSYLAKKGEVVPQWYAVDASGKVLGRLAVEIANVLRGRHKPTYTPHTDTGDCVVVTNAEKIVLTGRKEAQKQYMFYTGWVGNEKYRSVRNPITSFGMRSVACCHAIALVVSSSKN